MQDLPVMSEDTQIYDFTVTTYSPIKLRSVKYFIVKSEVASLWLANVGRSVTVTTVG